MSASIKSRSLRNASKAPNDIHKTSNKGYNVRWFKWSICFVFLKSCFFFFCYDVDIFDIVHHVEAIFHLPYLLIASGNRFLNMSDARETAIVVSRTSLIFKIRFPGILSS